MGYGRPDPYYDPEHFGLEPVATIDFSDGYYQFDYLAVWREKETGRLFYAEDSGCSCPSPFEGISSIADLTPVGSPDEIYSRVAFRIEDSYYDSEKSRLKAELLDLKSKFRN